MGTMGLRFQVWNSSCFWLQCKKFSFNWLFNINFTMNPEIRQKGLSKLLLRGEFSMRVCVCVCVRSWYYVQKTYFLKIYFRTIKPINIKAKIKAQNGRYNITVVIKLVPQIYSWYLIATNDKVSQPATFCIVSRNATVQLGAWAPLDKCGENCLLVRSLTHSLTLA